MTFEDCSSFAIHDLAALAEGNLSPEGRERLAGHLRQCPTCMETLAAMVKETPSGKGTGDVTLAACLVRAMYENVQTSGGGSDDTVDYESRSARSAVTKIS